jgi:hypothetical protein
MTATKLTFEAIDATFEEVYARFAEGSGENAPDSYTFYERTLEDLDHEVNVSNLDAMAERAERVGDGNVVAWIYECNGPSLTAVGEGATEAQVARLFESCMGLEA